MDKLKSVFLDVCRLIAALIVVYGHGMDFFFPNHNKDPRLLYNMAHFAVVIFFVLSGYVIGYTTKSNNRGPFKYALARFSRLTSVVIPALIFTFIVEISLSYLSPHFITEFQRGVSTPRYFISASFLNEIWYFSSAPPLNRPLWSVSFEFFFYFIFGVYFFTKKFKLKVIFTCIACLIAGPKILILFPVWIAGYMAYNYSSTCVNIKNFYLFFISTLFIYASYLYVGPIPFKIGSKPFYFANQFVTDWITGFLFAFSLWVFPEKCFFEIPDLWVKVIRKIADFTFPIYVLHYPTILFCKGALVVGLSVKAQFYVSMSLALAVSILLGHIFETYRYLWRNFFSFLFYKLKK